MSEEYYVLALHEYSFFGDSFRKLHQVNPMLRLLCASVPGSDCEVRITNATTGKEKVAFRVLVLEDM